MYNTHPREEGRRGPSLEVEEEGYRRCHRAGPPNRDISCLTESKMPKLRIPDRQAPHLAEFLRLSPTDLAVLVQTLREEAPRLALTNLTEAIATRLSVDRERIDAIVGMLAGLEVVKEGDDLPVKEFVAELRAAMEASGREDLQTSDWSAFEQAMESALSEDSALALSTKALGVMQDHARIFCSGRVLTDLRPIFRSSVEQDPLAFVTVHTLKIAYHEAGEHREFYVALDLGDVQKLASLLERAIKKEESLKAITTEKGLKVLEPSR